MLRQWTEAQKQARSEAYKKKAALKAASAPDPESDPNPISDDIIESPTRTSRPSSSSSSSPAPSTFDPSLILSDLDNLPLESLSYDDCGLLLNSLSAATTKIGLTRRQRQEQLAAGAHRAPCQTCKRLIDISKAGGFQILTIRDGHFQPVNVYFCSQDCLLARNMPSHRTKKLPGDVGART